MEIQTRTRNFIKSTNRSGVKWRVIALKQGLEKIENQNRFVLFFENRNWNPFWETLRIGTNFLFFKSIPSPALKSKTKKSNGLKHFNCDAEKFAMVKFKCR